MQDRHGLHPGGDYPGVGDSKIGRTIEWGASCQGAGTQFWCSRGLGWTKEVQGLLSQAWMDRWGQAKGGEACFRGRRSESIGCGGHGEASGQKSFLLLKLRKKRVWPASEKEPSACQGGHHSLPSQKKSTLGAFFEESDLPSPHYTIFITRSLERRLPMAQMVKNLPKMQETRVWFLGQEDPLEEGMATHSGILAWRIPWTESLAGYGVAELDTTDWLNDNKQQPVIYPPVQFSSVVSDSVTPWIAAHQASLSITNCQSLLKLMPIESVMPSSHRIMCRPLLLLPPIPPSIRVFSNESALSMRWPKYWSFSFSISPSNEHPGLISFRMDWLDVPKPMWREEGWQRVGPASAQWSWVDWHQGCLFQGFRLLFLWLFFSWTILLHFIYLTS